MKKLLLIIPFVLIICSCSAKPAQLRTDFAARAVAKYNETEFEANIESSRDSLRIEIIKPESIKGCVYSYTQKGFKMSLNGLELGSEDNCLPDGAFPEVLRNVLGDACKNAELKSNNNSFAEYKGECKSGKYTIKANCETGYISVIEINGIDIRLKYN